MGGLEKAVSAQKTEIVFDLGFCLLKKYIRRDSNPQPSVPKSVGALIWLSHRLQQHCFCGFFASPIL